MGGWGRTSADCTTNEKGPVRNLKCRIPFTYKGRLQPGCATSRSPSSKSQECIDFKASMPDEYPKHPGDSIIISHDAKNTTCHAVTDGEHGWCQTVKGSSDEVDEYWGFCQAACDFAKDSTRRLATALQETHLEVLPLAVCKTLITAGNYDFIGKYELCAGKRREFKKIKWFDKQGDQFTFKGEITNYLGLNEDEKYPFSFYVAGTDSCNGDSGGPVYRWIDRVPTLIAIVARGYGSGRMDGCAEMNFPGIYTRTAKFLDWIQENAADGSC